MPDKPSGRSFASGVDITFGGFVHIHGNLWKPVEKDDTESLKVVCKDCVEKIPQKYECPTHGTMFPGETGRAKQLDDESLVLLTDEQIKEAKESKLPDKVFELNFHPRDEVEGSIVNAEGMYVFLPADIASETASILHDLIVKHPEYVFIGMINLKKNDKLFRLEIGMNDQLIFQEIAWFSDVKVMPEPKYDYVPKTYDLADTLVSSLVESFDPEEYTRAARERMAEAIDEASNEPVTANGKAKAPAKPKVSDAEGTLMSALALVATKKKATKKAPAKKAAPVRKAS